MDKAHLLIDANGSRVGLKRDQEWHAALGMNVARDFGDKSLSIPAAAEVRWQHNVATTTKSVRHNDVHGAHKKGKRREQSPLTSHCFSVHSTLHHRRVLRGVARNACITVHSGNTQP
jgi:hypothetical protein